MTEYFVLEPKMKGSMLLFPLRDVGDQGWTEGNRFTTQPETPVIVKIRNGYEDAEPPSFMSVPPILSDALFQVLRSTGIQNLDIYDAKLRSSDGQKVFSGFKAYNLIGVKSINEAQKLGLKMFRFDEFTSAIIVARTIKQAIETSGIPRITFNDLDEIVM